MTTTRLVLSSVLATWIAAHIAAPDEPPHSKPSERMRRRDMRKEALSVVFIHESTTSWSQVCGRKSYPIPSTWLKMHVSHRNNKTSKISTQFIYAGHSCSQ